MKTVMCYGDSNTWGYDPATAQRFPQDVRWTGVLQELLGPEYRVIEEGLNGRTTVWDDPIEGYKNGREYLIPCLESQKPLDLVIIMLGTNDTKVRFSLSAFDIAEGAGVLVDIVQKSAAGLAEGAPQVLLMAPGLVGKLTDYAEMLEGAPAKADRFAAQFRRVADELGCHFLDTAPIWTPSDLDGIHFEAPEHRRLAAAVAAKVRDILG
jgi:lysophospholipase L1-like esterase